MFFQININSVPPCVTSRNSLGISPGYTLDSLLASMVKCWQQSSPLYLGIKKSMAYLNQDFCIFCGRKQSHFFHILSTCIYKEENESAAEYKKQLR